MGYQNLNKKELIREVRYLSDKLKKSQNLLESILKNEIDADEVCSDKTEQLVAKVNEEHLAAKKKAENSDQLKTAFISNISHEIRTPINSILGYSKILMESASDEQQKNHINVISKSGRYFNQMLKEKKWKQIGEMAHKILPSYRHLHMDKVIPKLVEIKTRTLIDSDYRVVSKLVRETIAEIESLIDDLKKEISE